MTPDLSDDHPGLGEEQGGEVADEAPHLQVHLGRHRPAVPEGDGQVPRVQGTTRQVYTWR